MLLSGLGNFYDPKNKKIVITGTLSAASAPKVLILAGENELVIEQISLFVLRPKVIRRTPCLYFTLCKCVYNLGLISFFFPNHCLFSF